MLADRRAAALLQRRRHADRVCAAPRARRRLESAWHNTREPRIGATLANRQHGQPDHVLQISNRAQQRLHRVHTRRRARGKPANVTDVACARELAGFLWAAATAN